MVSYVIDPLNHILYKGVRNEKDYLIACYGWNEKKKKWESDWEEACGMFIGFEPARKISKEEAMEITGGVE